MTDRNNSAAVGQPALPALRLSRVQQILRDVRDRLIVDLEKHEAYNAGVCDACNDAIDAVTAEPGTAQEPALRAQLEELIGNWRAESNAEDAQLKRYGFGGDLYGELLDEDIGIGYTINAQRRVCANELAAVLAVKDTREP